MKTHASRPLRFASVPYDPEAPRPPVMPDPIMSRVPKPDPDSGRTIFNFGPSHPSTHGTLRLVLEVEGEMITRAWAEIGYLHTGFEKLAETLNYNQFIPLSDRMNYLSAINNNVGYAHAIEELLGIEITERCKYVRTALAEMSRIADHLVCIGMQAVDIGAYAPFLWGFARREDLYDLFEAFCGARLTTSVTRIGGMLRDVSEDFVPGVRAFLDKLEETLRETDRLLTRNRIWMDRTQGIGVLSKEDALRYCVTGPVLRGSGIDHDIRKVQPYFAYDRIDFDVPIGSHGDVYDRYLVRLEEMWQSIRIIRQVLDDLPGGPINVYDNKRVLPPKEEVFTTIEGMIHHFELTMPKFGFKTEVGGQIYSCTESPCGELGFYVVSDGSGNPYRLRVRPPSFVNYAPIEHLVKGATISDVVAIIGSLNIIVGELDR
ncbi:MAG TPA: NADH-quinone oxidoreductase subunit D [Candidatus Latescibacteria bacterium]|nr:NADH-quinone oxidoreductase subunit D [Candidatus Latescibacterota bacterium]